MKIGLIGVGFVGKALWESFAKRGTRVVTYDKYAKHEEIEQDTLEDVAKCDVVFFCLPTPYVEGFGYDLSPIIENLKALKALRYKGPVVIKSTVEPGSCLKLEKQFGMCIMHNPEFLTQRTAFEDFDTQAHIVIGYNHRQRDDYLVTHPGVVKKLYEELYPDAEISICSTQESESMKIMCNSFYAMKVQIFNEFNMFCQRADADYDVVKDMMLKNKWINPMHTDVPGPDGKFSYGGACFPKDTKALKHLMKTLGTPYKVLEACIEERDEMRESKLY